MTLSRGKSRSTVTVPSGFGMVSSNPGGVQAELTASARFADGRRPDGGAWLRAVVLTCRRRSARIAFGVVVRTRIRSLSVNRPVIAGVLSV